MLALEVAVEEEEEDGGADWSAATAEWSDVIVGGVLELSLLLSFAVGVAAFSLAAAARSLRVDDVDMLLLLCVMRVSSCRTITQQ